MSMNAESIKEGALYIAKLNPLRRYSYIEWLVLTGIFGIFTLAGFFGWAGGIAGVVIVLTLLITILLRIDTDRNILLFKDDTIVYIKKDSAAPIAYTYDELTEVAFVSLSKEPAYTRFTFKNSTKYQTVLERAGGLDAHKADFIAFLWERSPGISVFENINLEKAVYKKLHGEIRRISI